MKAGLGETWNAILHKPFADTVREKEAKRRQSIDTSAADDADPIDKTKAVPAVEKLPWAERVVQGNDGAALMDSVSTKHSPQSHAEREAMRKLLEDVQPPTSSIH